MEGIGFDINVMYYASKMLLLTERSWILEQNTELISDYDGTDDPMHVPYLKPTF